ncbi:hypothetical protein Aab01nite_34050 [Paractinoplanes abujensis]|uniref:Uncharacterized protein n=1 Tax=Paractinoplanes abujensis TaxID=882441 RepID=A0A7W7CZZ5_9ACTN|nr:hypothetical protein [Actinoplanes abujensis]MBB4697696.1 hypothetical protein [Actinoplanes abujensis]GID19815.1 hypothetical protein Aab01nite_34050 [Actinoplanes abujensis]
MTSTPLDRTLNASLIVAPVVYLIADVLYAVRGWDDPAAAVFHILGAVAYTVVVLRLVTLGSGRLAVALLLVGALGAAGNVAYGFNTIHVALGDTDLVDAGGAATIIKPLGLFFPLTLLLAVAVLRPRGPAGVAPLLLVAGLAWPVAHIANIGWLAVAVNLVLVAAFGAAARGPLRTMPPATAPVGHP